MKVTKRAAKRRRKLLNKLARKAHHQAVRREKLLRLNAVVVPCSGDGWGYDEENACYVDLGGQVARLILPARSTSYEKQIFADASLQEVRACLMRGWAPTRDAITRRWPETVVKLNWSGELVPWEFVEHRLALNV